MHPHGVFYDKASEGAGTRGVDNFYGVPPGGSYTYEWYVTEQASPLPDGPSSIVWLYHSHVDEAIDTNSGLVGAIIVSRAGIDVDSLSGRPTDVDKEFVLFFTVFDENLANYLGHNIDEHTIGQNATLLSEDEDFEEHNLKHAINGLAWNNLMGLEMNVGQKVRWHLLALGTEVDLHTAHFHALTSATSGHRTDVFELLAASMLTIDTVPDVAGEWMVHCHVNDHFSAGMMAMYTASIPSDATPHENTISSARGVDDINLPSSLLVLIAIQLIL
jgi:FtsP/CotA-like multicopper oxidase with cupredoxin domain